LLYRRIRVVGNLSVILLGGVLLGCLWIAVSGLTHLSAARIFDFPPGAFRFNWVFWGGLGHATLYALYDYFGYYNVCYLGEEIRDPGRVIPRAILFSIAAVAVLYVLMNTAILSVVPWREAEQSSFIASTYIEKLYGRAAGDLITLLMLWIAFASVFSLLLGYSRIPYAAAVDQNFFRAPGLERPFRMWLYPVPGLLSVLGWLYILMTSARKSLLFALAVFALGSITFFVRAVIRREWPFGNVGGRS
jgi:amino acid transporter